MSDLFDVVTLESIKLRARRDVGEMNIEKGARLKVYSVRDSEGITSFLTFFADRWFWIKSDSVVPLDSSNE